jgi:hypothetical protein
MQIVEILLWIVGAFITISWSYGIRSYVRTGRGVTQQTVNQTMLFALALTIVPIVGLSSFHLLWMFIAGFVLGALSLAFPFSLLSIPGRMFGAICCIGLARV